ncbi:hypothetical protein [Nocardioides taihuensis]|uniref:Uncharacterized protein n=1 Tax=Nocardioides taihuensis TaxID=1835606 RepID=A0ABW0BPW5_9ACTN
MSDLTRKAGRSTWLQSYRNRSAESRRLAHQLRDIKRDINTQGLTRGAC